MVKKGFLERFSEALTVSDNPATQMAYLETQKKTDKQRKSGNVKLIFQKGGARK